MSNDYALRMAIENLGRTALQAVDDYNVAASLPPSSIKADSGQRQRHTDNVSSSVNEGIDATLDERGKRYGSYMEKAHIIQDIKKILRAASSWEKMDPDMQESLEMVVHKIGRIVTGDPEYLDSWTDVIGYTKLVEDRLKGVAR